MGPRHRLDLRMSHKKKPRSLPEILTVAEGESLLSEAARSIDAAKTAAKHLAARRDLAMILTGWYAGLRVFELCKQCVEDIDLRKPVLRVKRGKNGKDRNLPIGITLRPYLEAWIDGRTSGFLFPGPRGRKLSTRTFQLRLAALAKRAGFS